jgi:hypothetical protein
MDFIKVTASECNAQGLIPKSVRISLELNSDLVAVIVDKEVLLKAGMTILDAGGRHFKDFTILPKVPPLGYKL